MLHTLRHQWTIMFYALLSFLVVASIIFIMFLSPQARVSHIVAQDALRTGYHLNNNALPSSMKQKWSQDGYEHLISSPGVIIAATQNSVRRLDKDSGETVWEYTRPGGVICDMTQAWGDAVVIYNMGKGCTDVTRLEGATGQYVSQAMYANDQDVTRMVFSNGRLAIVTPHNVRVLRDDLVTTTRFGEFIGQENKPEYSQCDIYDATVGPESLVVSHKCNGSETTHVTAIEVEPDDSASPDTINDVDTRSVEPATTPIATLAQMKFITQGIEPIDYTWQLDKDLSEVSGVPVRQGEYGLWGDSFNGIGYVWLVGDTMYSRYGSEDVSQYTNMLTNVRTPAVEADMFLLVGMKDGFSLWNTHDNTSHKITVDSDISSSRDVAFEGDTIASLNNGTVVAFS